MPLTDNVTPEMIAKLRRYIDEPTTTVYSDPDLTDYIAQYPLIDPRGEEAFTWDTSTSPPTMDENDDWIATFDLHAAAAELWGEKAATIAEDFNFTADGATYNRSEAAERYRKMARFHSARRRAKASNMWSWPQQSAESLSDIVGNLAEEDD